MAASVQTSLAPARPAPTLGRSRTLLAGLALGGTTQALFYDAPLGANFSLWVLGLSGCAIALALRKGKIPRRGWGAAALTGVTGLAVTLRASEWSLGLGLPLAIVLLASLPAMLDRDASSVEDALLRALGAPLRVPRAVEGVARASVAVLDGDGRTRAVRIFGGLLFGAPVAVLFGLLLAFDPAFVQALDGARERAASGLLVALYVVLSGVGLLVAHGALHASRPAVASPGQPFMPPYRGTTDAEAPVAQRPGLVSPLTWGLIVGQVAVVFLVYGAVNLRTWFGGHAVVRETHETYASHLHAGFFQLLLAASLSVGLVLFGHWLLRPSSGDRRGRVPGGWALVAVETTLLAATGGALASCWQCLHVYEEAYGATYLRLGVAFVCIAVAFVIAWTTAKALHRDLRSYASVVFTGLAVLGAGMALFNADRYVAETNLDRAARGAGIDDAYLEGLSQDACGVLGHGALGEARRASLSEAWRAERPSDVRGTRGLLGCLR